MNTNNKQLGGLFSGMPSYHILGNQSQNPQNNDVVKLIQQEENKFWSVRPLYLFATMQMIFGMFLFFAQIALNNDECPCEIEVKSIFPYKYGSYEEIPNVIHEIVCKCQTSMSALWCGGIIFLTGLTSALATKYKTNFLLVLSSFLCVVGYGVSICCLIMSAVYAQGEFTKATHKGTFVAMAVISGFNFLIFVLTSALFCRASCSCCQPHTPTIMYLSSVEDSAANRQTEVSNMPR